MNNKITIIGDLHLHNTPRWRFDFIKEKLSKYKNEEIWLLGDIFEVKDRIPCDVLNVMLDFCLTNKVVLLSGQHDSYLPNVSSVEGLKSRVTIVDRDVLHYNNCYFVPFHRDLDQYRNWLSKIPDGATIMTHMPLEEAIHPINPNFVGINLNDYSRFSCVISGDIHNGKTFTQDNLTFVYTGVYAPRDFRDKGYIGTYIEYADNLFTKRETEAPMFVNIDNEKQLEKLKGRKLVVRTDLDIKQGDNIIECTKNLVKNAEIQEMVDMQSYDAYVKKIYIKL